MQKLFATISVILCLLIPNSIGAIVDTVNVQMTPQIPGPKQDVRVRISAFGFDLRGSNIIWVVDGKPEQEGVGLVEFVFTTKDIGETTNIKLVITTPTQQVVTKETLVTPGEIDILWEADTYTPPFYKGKALPTHSSVLRFTAIPLFSQASNPGIYSYKWINGRVATFENGLGKQTASYKAAGTGKKLNVAVELTDNQTGVAGTKSVDILTIEPMIGFYQIDPLYGIQLDKGIRDGQVFSTRDVEIQAVPYYFSTDDIETGRMKYLWSNNITNIPNSAFVNRVVVSDPGETAITVRIRNTSRVMQDVLDGIRFTLAQ